MILLPILKTLVLRGFHAETKNYTIHQSGANFTPGLNKVETLPLLPDDIDLY